MFTAQYNLPLGPENFMRPLPRGVDYNKANHQLVARNWYDFNEAMKCVKPPQQKILTFNPQQPFANELDPMIIYEQTVHIGDLVYNRRHGHFCYTSDLKRPLSGFYYQDKIKRAVKARRTQVFYADVEVISLYRLESELNTEEFFVQVFSDTTARIFAVDLDVLLRWMPIDLAEVTPLIRADKTDVYLGGYYRHTEDETVWFNNRPLDVETAACDCPKIFEVELA